MATYILNIDPHTKPRMTRSDKWKHRTCVDSYFVFKNKLKFEAKRVKMPMLPGDIELIKFLFPMPKTWSKKKKAEMLGKPHQQTPDVDNCLKAVFDSLLKQDKIIWSVRVEKYWVNEGKIIIQF